jgi:hypothetical protein
MTRGAPLFALLLIITISTSVALYVMEGCP